MQTRAATAATSAGSASAWIAADTLFHAAAVGAAGNTYLTAVYESVHTAVLSREYEHWVRTETEPPWLDPAGAPGMPEMVHLTLQLQGRGLGKDVALITDGRFSGVSHGILVGHISPEAARGGPIGIVRAGDTIVIDPGARTLDLAVDASELARRMAAHKPPARSEPLRPGSVMDKYVRLVSSAHYGCVLG